MWYMDVDNYCQHNRSNEWVPACASYVLHRLLSSFPEYGNQHQTIVLKIHSYFYAVRMSEMYLNNTSLGPDFYSISRHSSLKLICQCEWWSEIEVINLVGNRWWTCENTLQYNIGTVMITSSWSVKTFLSLDWPREV